jgi:predicted PurR-regulated permease PerM
LFPYLAVVGLLALIMTTAVPRVVDEGAVFSRKMPRLLGTLAEEVKLAAGRFGMERTLARYVGVDIPIRSSPEAGAEESETVTATRPSADAIDTGAVIQKFQQVFLGFLRHAGDSDGRASIEDVFGQFVVGVINGTLQFLLAILLSFLILLDFDRLGDELLKWRETSVGRFFQEAAASLVEFSGAVGTAFQCQIVVALLNATITCVGMAILDIRPLLLLTTIVFILGLIPVLGVFISSVPIMLIAFNDHGLTHALVALGMIVIVHLLEAYVFNPRIYAARFHLNPVIVLIILLVAHELFGVWGMLLGIPVTHYLLNVAQMPTLPSRRRRRMRGRQSDGDSEAMPHPSN